jgi:hypothetical protein
MAEVGRIEFGPKNESPFDVKLNHTITQTQVGKKLFPWMEEEDAVRKAANKLPPSFGNIDTPLQKCHEQENMFNPYAITPDEVDCVCPNPFRVEEDYHPKDALKKQVGGSHYKSYKIQPYEFFIKNQIPHHKAAIIRRILRYDHPTGKGLEDLQKIQHEIDLIIQLENWEERSGTPTETEEDR